MPDLICKYCRHQFKQQARFDNHQCEEMKRLEFIETPKGRSAFYYYKEWLRASKGNVGVTVETFLNSRYFSSFVKFIGYSNSMLIPNKLSFVNYMATLDILPIHWCHDDIYINYIENLDKTYTPVMQAEETIKTLRELADIFECNPVQIFDHLQPGDCVKLLKSRKLSPWVLMFSKTFHQYLAIKLTKEQRVILQTIINPNLWKNKFKNRPSDVENMKKIVKELGL